MPVLPKPVYKTSFWQRNRHVQTIYPSIFRRVRFSYQHRERVELADGDFIDLDWAHGAPNNKKLVVITHGLEGDSNRHYVLGMAKLFSENGYDALGWNCRSCSGEINRLPRFYHHGDANDLREVVRHAISKYHYEEIVLTGFSMGGSLTLRMVSEDPANVPREVKATVSFSVPCDLLSSVNALSQPGNRVYKNRFLKKLGVKIRAKEKMFPDKISADGYNNIKNFIQFDTRYTAPLHGYKDAHDFYAKASVRPLLGNIKVPSLIVQALNDPFLLEECFCYEEAEKNPNLFLETPENGGHCGFMLPGNDHSWAELRALAFAKSAKNLA